MEICFDCFFVFHIFYIQFFQVSCFQIYNPNPHIRVITFSKADWGKFFKKHFLVMVWGTDKTFHSQKQRNQTKNFLDLKAIYMTSTGKKIWDMNRSERRYSMLGVYHYSVVVIFKICWEFFQNFLSNLKKKLFKFFLYLQIHCLHFPMFLFFFEFFLIFFRNRYQTSTQKIPRFVQKSQICDLRPTPTIQM